MKIAVIGSGISGNVAAYHLNKQHDITVFEANDYIGGHTHTHDIEWAGQHYAVDTGFIVFNERTYPHFIALLDELGVDSHITEMSFSVKNEKSGLEYNGHSLNSLFAQRRNLFSPSFHRMIRDILRFNRQAPRDMEEGQAEIGLGEYLKMNDYSQQFIEHYIIPMGAAIWSTDPLQMQQFPARFFIRFFHNHGLLNVSNRPNWFTIRGGSKQYVAPLVHSFKDKIHLRSPIESVRRYPTHVEIKPLNQSVQKFDALFIAAHSNQALDMLEDATAAEKEVLGAIRYQPNEAVLHTDESVLPKRKLAWASWNYHMLEQQEQQVALTYNMNILQGHKAPVQFCVTLNNSDAIDKKKIIKTISYDHPLYTAESVNAQQRQQEINGVARTFYCGAYWRNGFHEDGVVSALNALEHFNHWCDAETNSGNENEKLYLRRAS
ncbi:MAG: FAD-dependent oxidoreductase [Gammaproteobacteria bacterium]|nr:FAD-dependent oxidoreductase [Gammaproteobacteria bacterium]